MDLTRALTRRPADTLGRGLTTRDLGPPDPELAQVQFERYVAALEGCGLEVTVLDPLPELPDAHFVEDAAVVTPEVAVIARPGAEVRRDEAEQIAPVLAEHRELARIETPGTLDGGDVLILDDQVLIGISERTNGAGAHQLGEILGAHGYAWRAVPVDAGLHLKSGVNHVGGGVLLMDAGFAGLDALDAFERIVVPEGEDYACNTLLVNGRLLTPAGFPATYRRLEDLGREILELDVSEFRKMDGGLTCLSLRF
jgi:dimethylargininase